MNIDPYAELTYGVLDDGPIDFEDNPAIAALSETIENDRGRTYPPQLRALALNLWTFDAARNPRRVVELLKERAGIEVGENTIRNWAAKDNWEERAGELHQTFAISASRAVEAELDRGKVLAVSALNEIMQDHEANASARVRAAQSVLAITGYVPQMSSSVNLAVNMGRSALADATDDELYERSLSYRPDDPDAEHPPIEATYTENRIARQSSARSATRHDYTPSV